MSNVNYNELKSSDFFNFFNLHEIKDQKTSQFFKKLKPGGFQEYIDIELYLNNNNDVEKAQLGLDRKWIGNYENINPFGKDLAKSFIDAVVPYEEKEGEDNVIILLVHFLFNMVGTKDKIIPCTAPLYHFEESSDVVKTFLDVYRNLIPSYELSLKHSKIEISNIMQNNKPRLIIKWVKKI
jgi:hypothetical protein